MNNSTLEQSEQVSQEEIRLAEPAEQDALNESQKTYLLKRVVLLRIQNNRLRSEVKTLADQLAEYNAKEEPSESTEE